MTGIDSDFIKEDKVVVHTVNGLSRFLMLWIIKNKGPIHGYGVMKELDKFFESLIDKGVLKKSKASKIYPILKKMEESELITGESITQYNNKEVKFFSITQRGEFLLYYIRDSYINIRKTSHGSSFFEDFLNPK